MFPDTRLRRYRRTPEIRDLFNEPIPPPSKFVWPVFLTAGKGICEPIDAMPGQNRMSADVLVRELEKVANQGVNSILLFAQCDRQKDDAGTAAFAPNGVVQKAIAQIKKEYPGMIVMTDVCLCAYTNHGHCGPLKPDGSVDNDAACEMLARTALSHARAGADVVAPSAMMDGQILSIRQTLDEHDFSDTLLMSYSTKFASHMYGPFRDAEKSAPGDGDRQGYQTSFSNARLALRESECDEEEGADILMVKPALFYLDMIKEVRDRTDLPVAAYNVSGEYSMLIATADRGWGDLRGMVRESIVALQRAGTDIFISYWASRYNEFFY